VTGKPLARFARPFGASETDETAVTHPLIKWIESRECQEVYGM